MATWGRGTGASSASRSRTLPSPKSARRPSASCTPSPRALGHCKRDSLSLRGSPPLRGGGSPPSHCAVPPPPQTASQYAVQFTAKGPRSPDVIACHVSRAVYHVPRGTGPPRPPAARPPGRAPNRRAYRIVERRLSSLARPNSRVLKATELEMPWHARAYRRVSRADQGPCRSCRWSGPRQELGGPRQRATLQLGPSGPRPPLAE